MAGVKRCLGIDVGSQSIKLVEMATDKDGVRIVRVLTAPIPVGPEAQGDQHAAATVSTIKSLIKEHKISAKDVVLSMNGRSVFVKPGVRVPVAPGPQLKKMIHFEARQLIPFPLDKTMVEYQVFELSDGREVEVLLVAMKKETNLDFMRQVKRMGLKPVGICVSPLALFNGQELSQIDFEKEAKPSKGGGLLGLGGKKDKDKSKKKKKGFSFGKKKKDADEDVDLEAEAAATVPDDEPEEDDFGADIFDDGGFDEVRAYVNLGASNTELAIGRSESEEGLGFIRTVPLGGNIMTNAVMKACSCETFTQAEEIKCTRSAMLSGMFEIEADQSAFDENACKAVTVVGDKIIAELRRSIDFFISQPNGVAVDTIVLSGGGALMEYFPSYIEERMGMPVEVTHTLGNSQIKCPAQYSEDFDYAPYKVAVGLALQGLDLSPLKINFLPADIKSMQNFSTQYVEVAALAAMIGGMVFFGSQIGNESIAGFESEIRQYQQVINSKGKLKTRRETAQANMSKIETKLLVLERATRPNNFWMLFLSAMQKIKPPEVLITHFSGGPDYNVPIRGDVMISGEAEDRGAVGRFLFDLKKLTDFVEDAEYSRISSGNQRSTHFTSGVVKFRIRVRVKDAEGGMLTRLPVAEDEANKNLVKFSFGAKKESKPKPKKFDGNW